jgi:hypothetical protein
MARCQKAHDMREYPVEVGSPQTQQQRDQVARVIKKISASNLLSPAPSIVLPIPVTNPNHPAVVDESSIEEKGSADAMEGSLKSDDSGDQDCMTDCELVADILGDQMAEVDVDDGDRTEDYTDVVSIDLPRMDSDNETDENKPMVENSDPIVNNPHNVPVAPVSKVRSTTLPRIKTTARLPSVPQKSPKSTKEQVQRPISPTKSSNHILASQRYRSTSQSSQLSKEKDPPSPVSKFTSGSPRPKETSMSKKANLPSPLKEGRKLSLSSIKEVQEPKLKPPSSSTSAMPPPHRTPSGLRSARRPLAQPGQLASNSKSSSSSSKGSRNDISRSVSPQAYT